MLFHFNTVAVSLALATGLLAAPPAQPRARPNPSPPPKNVSFVQQAELLIAAEPILAQHLPGMFRFKPRQRTALQSLLAQIRATNDPAVAQRFVNAGYRQLAEGLAGFTPRQAEFPHLDLVADWLAEADHWKRAFRGGEPSQFLDPGAPILPTDRDAADTSVRRLGLLAKRLRADAPLAALARAAQEMPVTNPAAREVLFMASALWRHKLALANPVLDFDRLLIVKAGPPLYSHMCDQYLGRHSVAGPGLVVLTNWQGRLQENVLLAGKLPTGAVHHPALSFDGQRIAFAYADHTPANHHERRYWLYEINADGTGLRRLTGGTDDALRTYHDRQTVVVEDWDPCYLPDGGLMFISTRSQGFGRCHGGRYTPSYTLFRLDGDVRSIRPVSHGEANEWRPAVLHDGRVAFCRWDYINRHDVLYQSLWTIRPDGTGVAHFYGNQTRPCMISEPQPVPGSAKVVATTCAHHGWTTGSTVLVDADREQDGPEPLTRITPDFPFPEAGERGAGTACTPWPLSDEFHLVAMSWSPLRRQGGCNATADYGIYLVDGFGNKTLIYRDPNISSFSPIPLRARPVPPALASSLPAKPAGAWGTFIIRDIQAGRCPQPPGTITALRVNRLHTQPAAHAGARGRVANEVVKGVVGTVPVAPDGSVAFRAPANEPLQFQALDAHGRAVMTMRSFTFLQPGEVQSCVGCHESRYAPVPPATPQPQLVVRTLTPPDYGGTGEPFQFRRIVQPVLDRHCLGCHGLDRVAGNVDLLGAPPPRGGQFSRAYLALSDEQKDYVKLAHRNDESVPSVPGDYFARAGKLYSIITSNHADRVKLAPVELQRIVEWLDLNAQFCSYAGARAEWRPINPVAEQALRAHVAARFGDALAKQPFHALVNDAALDDSRILKAPLAVSAGGWGQLQPSWPSVNDPGYQKTRQLIEAALTPVVTATAK